MSNFLYKNFIWTFGKKNEDNLLTLSTTGKQYTQQLYKLSEKYFPEQKQVDTVSTEFYLNEVALLSAKNKTVNIAKNYFDNYWTDYVRIKNLLNKKYLTFPANNVKTRPEAIAELIAKCSQFAVDEKTIESMTEEACNIMQLSDKEARYLPQIVNLYKIKFYCQAVIAAHNGSSALATGALAKLLKPALIRQGLTENKHYCQAPYGCDDNALISVVDCMGNSATRFDGIITKLSTKMYLYANGRNVFDTFVTSRFGSRICEFESKSKTLNVSMRYFITGNCEIRKITVKNLSKNKRKFVTEILTKRNEADTNYFNLGDALCVASDSERLYVANVVVTDNKTVAYYGEKTQNYEYVLTANEQIAFDIVTIFAHDTPAIAQELDNLHYLGATECPYVYDEPSKEIRHSDIQLNLTSSGFNLKRLRKEMSDKLNYTYQLGDCDTATFVDNGGNSATLIKGFVFGINGESVYSARGGIIDKINDGNFHIDVDTLRYDKKTSSCVIAHNDGKVYEVTHKTPCKTLFLFPFERKSQVEFCNNTFSVKDGERAYEIVCANVVESYTTNALECSEDKLRYKLSDNLNAGTCLAICFATATSVKLTIRSTDKTPMSAPIVRESLVSTYLNYINDKNVFCLANYIKKPDALTVAALCYTNPKFVKKYLVERFKTQQIGHYYDVSGRRKAFDDKTTFPLTYAYYRNLVGDDLPKSFTNAVNGVIFGEEFTGKELCIKALAVKKLAQLGTEDKVRYLVEYNKLKKIISADSKLYAYAQAIGALPMINPSKARLKDLCNKYDIPKSWYYVSQLENLYGLKIFAGKLFVTPSITAENALEQLALNIDGKRIDTTFTKATVKSMTLNGTQCFQPFCAAQLKNYENQLVVRY